MLPWIATGALCCALAVVGGAFGAHALSGRLDPHARELWETAARYLVYGGFGQIAAGLLAGSQGGRAAARRPGRGADLAGGSLLAGAAIFSGTLGGLALGAPRWLGAVTPLGGLLLIAGFALLAWAAPRR